MYAIYYIYLLISIATKLHEFLQHYLLMLVSISLKYHLVVLLYLLCQLKLVDHLILLHNLNLLK